MKIGLIDIEPKIFNTAYMQIARYHKDRGDTVEWWTPLTDSQFDYVCCSSLFDFTDKNEVPARAICGGTGFDITSQLSVAIEHCELDYSIYPRCRTSFIWFSRGCIRNCPWCVVPKKEGRIKIDRHNYGFNPKAEYITVMDNNFFANKAWRDAIKFLLEDPDEPVDIEQGVDVRLLTEEMCQALNKLRHYKQIKIAWDNPRENLVPKLQWLIRQIKPYKLMCYVLIGFNSTEQQDLYRVETLRSLGIDSFAMPYNKSDLYQRTFARWVNHKAIHKKVKWEDYRGRVLAQEAAGTGWN